MEKIMNREITLCETCDTFFEYSPQKLFCDECSVKRRREYHQRPEVKKRRREYTQRPDQKEKKREYDQRPEVKEKKREYYQRPEVKERYREYMREYYHRKKAEREEEEA